MDTSKLKKFASFARTSLIEQVGTRLKTVLAEHSLARRENAAAVAELEKKIKELGKERVIEMVAYTWFNRFCALRFMDVNQYTTIGTVSPAEGFTQPEILTEAKQGVIDEELKVDRAKIIGLLDGTRPSQDAQGEVYQQLLIAVCNSYHKLMPFMFEKIADYTELLIPEDLLSDSSVLAETRKALTAENCTDVEVIGWLYQFYISEKKDDVFAALKKGKKITPENIPAATQLFTPHWIVRYLVENSLGRLWMLNRPDSRLVEQMDYYIRPEEPETDFLKISSPEEIKVCDPACGSGHMLTYAFDLLYAIYEEQGYQATDIPRLILKHNLYGVEIDQRAGALAAFALVMKAREKDKRFFTRKSQPDASARDSSSIQNPKSQIQNPNVCVLENISFDQQELSDYIEQLDPDLFTDGIRGVVNQWEEADNFGSLIRPLVTDVSDVLDLLRERQMGQDLFLADVHQKVLKALRQADYLSPKYHVVVANPPYMGSGAMNPMVKEFAKERYENAKADLFACFINRGSELSKSTGYTAMITMQSWMFLSAFERLRVELLESKTLLCMAHLGPGAFSTISGEVVQTSAFVFKNHRCPEFRPSFQRLISGGEEEKRIALINKSGRFIRFSQRDFEKIPGAPIAYWISQAVLQSFKKHQALETFAETLRGMTTCDNDFYVRFWWEVSLNRITYGSESRTAAKEFGAKWFPYTNGGGFRKWAGNCDSIVNWENDGAILRSRKHPEQDKVWAHNFNLDHIFREGATYSSLTSGSLALRYTPAGYLFDQSGSMVFANLIDIRAIMALLNSKLAMKWVEALCPTVNLNPGSLLHIPVHREALKSRKLLAIVDELIRLATADWNMVETGGGFQISPLTSADGSLITDAYATVRDHLREATTKCQVLENELNAILVTAYEFDEVEPTVPLEEITLIANPSHRFGSGMADSETESLLLADTMREFISYAVGCMLGRYSLDKPGLILANQGETVSDYRKQVPEPTFAPDEDNVIPLLDGDWFTDDITERFKEFLKVTFGTEHYEENLKFLEDALYPDNLTAKKRKTIRDYFLKDFYSHHIKLYKKRPIYWLFSSPKGTFNALIYMHRYRPDTVGTVLHYLRDFRDKLTHHADHQQMLADSASASKSEKTQAIKDVAAIKKQLKELEDYEKTLFEVAARKIDIDLDDGVKHNYLLFGSVLRKIPGLDAKED